MRESLPPFVLFGSEHLFTVGVITAAWVTVIVRARRNGSRQAWRGARALAVTLVGYHLVETWVRWAVVDVPLSEVLPLHVCGILFYVSAYALWTGHQLAYEIAYFWTFAGTSHSLITPDVPVGFPTLHYFSFFASHGLLLLAALYATLVLRMRPQTGSVWRALMGINLFAVAVAGANLLLGTNYMFLMAKPAASTLMDYLGPWPWYLASLEVLAVLSFSLWYLPFWLRDRAASGAEAGSAVTSQ